ncbi:SpaH/EbpB family LPXTG-anchored major pilin [Lacticaseibacillus nasuensis]|uniref:SpaH/EbpB family LPXTG-anchored major pilin n=1 Tax=Lacticaseibacillus nasuensis TaxID=944671 RepID=UPI0022474263|nr:SpaH/EbpB family LPXTG-anchored major pilin [Lacticaseibacillus nasuensis]MCX2455160.1 SpaH/EbpB family LPXTG-anchored major pilin [Lacticaseibacillus nasuensis]
MKAITLTTTTRALLAGMMTCSLALTAITATQHAAQPVRAENVSQTRDTTSVTLHKLGVKNALQIENNGQALPDTALPAGAVKLDGVKFQAYDVTELFWNVKNSADWQNKTNKETMTYISENWSQVRTEYSDDFEAVGDAKTTANGGQATWSDLATKQDDVYRIYLFEEVAGVKDYMKALPVVMGLPSENGVVREAYHFYPKNVGMQKDLLDDQGQPLPDTNEDGEIVYDFEVGQAFTYRTTLTLPANLDAMVGDKYEHDVMSFKDIMSEKGTDFVADSLTIKDGGTDVTAAFKNAWRNYQDSNGNNWGNQNAGFSFEIALNDPALSATDRQDLLALKGKTLTFEYQMRINGDATPTQDIGNTFTYGNKPVGSDQWTYIDDDAPEIETGGMKILKKSSQGAQAPLSGAEFKLSRQKNGLTEYAQLWWRDETGELTQDNPDPSGQYEPDEIEWVTEAAATTLISGSGNALGQINIGGLEGDDYKLKEVKAPLGYHIINVENPITVAEGEVGTVELATNNIFNTPDSGFLPVTGSTGILAFLIVGGLAMGSAVYYKKRRA